GHEHSGVEHLLYALTLDAATADLLRHAGADVERLRGDLATYLEEEHAPRKSREPSGARPEPRDRSSARREPRETSGTRPEPRLSLALQRVLGWAGARVESAGRGEIGGADLLVALFDEEESWAVELLADQGVSRLDVVSYLAHGVSRLAPARGP